MEIGKAITYNTFNLQANALSACERVQTPVFKERYKFLIILYMFAEEQTCIACTK